MDIQINQPKSFSDFLTIILMRVLKNDFSRYMDLEEADDMGEEETGRHWAGIAELAALSFEFMEKASPQGWATSHARRLRLFAPEHALSAGHLFDAALHVRVRGAQDDADGVQASRRREPS